MANSKGETNNGNNQGFSMPNSLLSQINECSGGGFFLLYFNEYGEPIVNQQYDNPIIATAANQYIYNWAAAINETELNCLVERMTPKKRRKKD